ncbi:DUF29 domain-containing protein [Aureimonas leprariae]|uniref:DUF29 domain-containing protein n=1 Tax=Plantimonas leprariae TaxID=2615207 RepID=A0A7V7PNJ1_9HYPH|nr:DUF29 domain-containing protein [Aureimonas leprariae]KAB0679288.1 DUF29 domain-containing protein [Aureimonas leprariae]
MAESQKKPVPYEEDFYAWTVDQAARLRARASFDNRGDIDWDNAAEELTSLGNSEESEIESRLNVLVIRLLKWAYQPDGRSSGWKGTIVEQRRRLHRRLRRSPSLHRHPGEVLAEEYDSARLLAAGETQLPENVFPLACPFTIEDILNADFYPEVD